MVTDMDWGLALIILSIIVLVGHYAIDAYRMVRNIRSLKHTEYEALDGWQCERCNALYKSRGRLRHEVFWTVLAVAFLGTHIVLDFV